MKKPDPEIWSAWWELDNATSFDGVLAGSYDGDFLAFWSKNLAHKPTHVIDLCCGNGGVTWLANNICNNAELSTKITGVDFTDIKPFNSMKRKRDDYPLVNFIGNTSVDSLPMDDKSVDMVISQFGIEYADLNYVIPEISRVLKNKAQIAFIMHCDWSVLAIDSLATTRRFEYLLGDGQFHEIVFELDELYNAKRSYPAVESDPLFNELHSRLKVAVYYAKNYTLKGKALPESTSVLSYVAKLVGLFDNPNKFKDRKRKKVIEEGLNHVVQTCERQNDLLNAVMTSDRLELAKDLLQQYGFQNPKISEFFYRNNIYGIQVTAERNI
jgi:SAM-dependent methyltransferase